MNKIIKQTFSEAFGKNIDSIEFYLDSPNSGNNVHLQTCALFEMYPMKFELPSRQFGSFRLRTRSGNEMIDEDHKELNDFDNVWKLVLENVKNNDSIIKIKKCLTELEIENRKLMKIYSDKIEMQWKV